MRETLKEVGKLVDFKKKMRKKNNGSSPEEFKNQSPQKCAFLHKVMSYFYKMRSHFLDKKRITVHINSDLCRIPVPEGPTAGTTILFATFSRAIRLALFVCFWFVPFIARVQKRSRIR